MEVTVRVMSCGKEIDRITGPLHIDGQQIAVTYRERLWPVEGVCIHVETEVDISDAERRPDRAEWEELVVRLVPESFPTLREECSELLRVLFKDNLPDGIVRAISSLAYVGLKRDAHELLIDFLSEKYDSLNLSRQLQPELVCSEKLSTLPCSSNSVLTFIISESDIEVDSIAEDAALQDWDWMATDEIQHPEIDDKSLRAVAGRIQEAIGTYRSLEKGTMIPSLVGPIDDTPSDEDSALPQYANTRSSEERVLVERTAKLGMVALDLLRYFADNPGDRAAHAELVLGYHVTDINKILSGSLSHYLKKNQSGGWVCHFWVSGVLQALDEAL